MVNFNFIYFLCGTYDTSKVYINLLSQSSSTLLVSYVPHKKKPYSRLASNSNFSPFLLAFAALNSVASVLVASWHSN